MLPIGGRTSGIMPGGAIVQGSARIVALSSLLVLGLAALVGAIACAMVTRPLGPSRDRGPGPTSEGFDAGFHADGPGQPTVAVG